MIVYKDPCKAGLSKAKAQGLKTLLDYALGDGQATIAKLLRTRRCPPALQQKAKTAVDGLQCNGAALSGS